MDVAAACVGVSAEGVERSVDEQLEPLFDGEACLACGDGGEEPGVCGLQGWVFLEWDIDGGHVGALVVCFQ